jgi:arylsulfatase A-like enzyme
VSDHGQGFGEWGYYTHVADELHDDLLSIPPAIRSPDREPSSVSTPVSTVDLGPTLLSECGIDVPGACVGQPLLAEGSLAADRLVFAHAGERHDGKVAAGDAAWRLVRDLGADSETLYRRDGTDPEREVRTGEYPDVTGRLHDAIDEHLAMVDSEQARTDSVDVSASARERLEQLGYR